MSTYAVIFLEEDNLYYGSVVKYDGHINHGVGQTLFENWNNVNDVRKLCTGSLCNFRILETSFEKCIPCKSQSPYFNILRKLTKEQMLEEAKQYEYCYLYKKYNTEYEWFVKSASQDDFDMLVDRFNDFQ